MSRPQIRGLLIDLSGTLHIGSTPTPDAVSALKRLRNSSIPFRLCSNSSKESTASLLCRLRDMGFDVQDNELWTSLGALKDLVRARQFKRPYCLLSKSAMEEFPEYDILTASNVPSHAEYDAVLVGLAPDLFTYPHLTNAFRILSANAHRSENTPAPFLATHRVRYMRTDDGELSLGPGPFVAALETAAGPAVRAEAVGKPSRTFFKQVADSMRADTEVAGQRDAESAEDDWYSGIAVVGDDIDADLGEGALQLGLWRVLVQTGKYRAGDETRSSEGVPPGEVQPSFAAFVEDLLAGNL